MGYICFKAKSGPKIPHEVISDLMVGLNHRSALPAYQVQVFAMMRQVEGWSAMVKVGVAHQVGAGQGLKISIDRGGR